MFFDVYYFTALYIGDWMNALSTSGLYIVHPSDALNLNYLQFNIDDTMEPAYVAMYVTCKRWQKKKLELSGLRANWW